MYCSPDIPLLIPYKEFTETNGTKYSIMNEIKYRSQALFHKVYWCIFEDLYSNLNKLSVILWSLILQKKKDSKQLFTDVLSQRHIWNSVRNL